MKRPPILEKLLQEHPSQGDYSLGLARAQELSTLLGHPYRAYPIIHVAGSNGKGSVTTKIAACLQETGYKTALYTSPHLFRIEERIQCDTQMIPEEDLCRILTKLYALSAQRGITWTFFELITFVAFLWFAEQQVDVAVIETGLGGRFDATNVVEPLLTVITSISLEHTERLGPTLASIAREKAGILKPGVPLVLGPKASHASIYERAEELASPCFLVSEDFPWYDEENQAIARKALEALQKHFSLPISLIGLQKRPPCRCEEKWGAIFDVAHNAEGLSHLYESLEHLYPGKQKRTVLGLSSDKDLAACLHIVAKNSSYLHLVDAKKARTSSTVNLAKHLPSWYTAYSQEPSVEEGVMYAKQLADARGELLVIAGSFYLMPEAQKGLRAYAERETS